MTKYQLEDKKSQESLVDGRDKEVRKYRKRSAVDSCCTRRVRNCGVLALLFPLRCSLIAQQQRALGDV